jgi:EAL and modified HD-GYP domain-containing signal transduction protein
MSDLMVVRQPVFDRADEAIGYEIRFKPLADGGDPLAQSLLSGSLDLLTGGLPAWVSVSREALESRMLDTPGTASVVALVSAHTPVTPDVLSALAALPAAGVVLAIDEFSPLIDDGSPVMQLLEHAHYVRMDARDMPLRELAGGVTELKRLGKFVVVDQIMDATTYNECKKAGADFYQGAHFSRPEPLPAASLPTSTIAALRVLALARDESVQDREIERAISADPAITFQLLRIVNSASIGGRGIESVGHALRLAGRNTLIKWLALATFTSRSGKTGVDNELTLQAVQRAYLAESMAKASSGRDPSTAFLVGLFSLIDAVFRIPMFEVVERINLSDDVREALMDRMGPYADFLHFIEAYELGLWETAREGALSLGVPLQDIADLYFHALRESTALVNGAVAA